ncbi:hypothetical protein ACSSS7_000575 [Eimeria intestinalis]
MVLQAWGETAAAASAGEAAGAEAGSLSMRYVSPRRDNSSSYSLNRTSSNSSSSSSRPGSERGDGQRLAASLPLSPGLETPGAAAAAGIVSSGIVSEAAASILESQQRGASCEALSDTDSSRTVFTEEGDMQGADRRHLPQGPFTLEASDDEEAAQQQTINFGCLYSFGCLCRCLKPREAQVYRQLFSGSQQFIKASHLLAHLSRNIAARVSSNKILRLNVNFKIRDKYLLLLLLLLSLPLVVVLASAALSVFHDRSPPPPIVSLEQQQQGATATTAAATIATAATTTATAAATGAIATTATAAATAVESAAMELEVSPSPPLRVSRCLQKKRFVLEDRGGHIAAQFHGAHKA